MANSTTKKDTDRIKRAHKALDLFDRIRSISWKGIFDGTIKAVFLVFVIVFITFLYNPKPVVEHFSSIYEMVQTEQHDNLIQQRMNNTPIINADLNTMMVEMKMDRTFIIEFHNGNNNLAALPFWWGDMTYECVDSERTYSARDNWLNISLTRYTFFNQVCTTTYYIGSLEDVAELDEGFAKKLAADDIKYIAACMLYSSTGQPLAVIGGVCTCNDVPELDHDTLIKYLAKYSQIVNPLLIGR